VETRSLPSVVAVANYWSQRDTFDRDWDHPGCFACGDWSQRDCSTVKPESRLEAQWQHSGLERCHLIARAEGGTNDVSNIVLLCKRCHANAPMTGISPQPMIHWINRQEDYILRMFRRLVKEIEAIRPTLLEEVEALGLSDKEWKMVLAVSARAMRLGYHGFQRAEQLMFASWAAVIQNIVDSLGPPTSIAPLKPFAPTTSKFP
jgi:hypothetical protein